MEKLQSVELIPFKNFKEKISITRKYDGKAKMEIIDNKFVYVEREERERPMKLGDKIETGKEHCDYCIGIYNSTAASWKRNFKYCPMCGIKLDFNSIIPADRNKRKGDRR